MYKDYHLMAQDYMRVTDEFRRKADAIKNSHWLPMNNPMRMTVEQVKAYTAAIDACVEVLESAKDRRPDYKTLQELLSKVLTDFKGNAEAKRQTEAAVKACKSILSNYCRNIAS